MPTVVHEFTDGAQVAVDEGRCFFLTPCCHASGKGAECGVVCRRCFAEVSWCFGDVGVPEDRVDPRFGIGTIREFLRSWMNADVAALVEAQVKRFAEDGKITPSSGGWIFYW